MSEKSKSGWEMIARERARQTDALGHTAAQDDTETNGQLRMAAMAYLAVNVDGGADHAPGLWPWEPECFKPKGEIRNLVRAGALIAAEIDRLQRAEEGESRAV